jgi:signal transduction histidine kinase/phage shock protein PspC (stress-responsive transcriptional regulator)
MRPPLIRSNDRVLAGVCSGLAIHLGLQVNHVRLAMAALALAGGAGIFLYAWLWILVPTAEERARKEPRNPRSIAENFDPVSGIQPGGPPAAPGEPRPGAAQPGMQQPEWQEPAVPQPGGGAGAGAGAPVGVPAGAGRTGLSVGIKEIVTGAVLLVASAVFLAQQLGAEIRWDIWLPVAAIALGAVIAWLQLDDSRRTGLMNRAGAGKAFGMLRLVTGLVLVIVGVLVMVSGLASWPQIWSSLLASLAVLAGVALVLAPWGLKFWRDLETERTGRIRETERAEIAAHLHDSVLQTLALIQNRASSEQDVTRLARAQERELRQWLYGDASRNAGNLADRIRAVAAEIEDAYGHPIDVVAVGDAPMSPVREALVQASREALLNASRHAGGSISVYLEAGSTGAEVFIRDRGPGFDLDAIPEDRLGVRESLIGRMQRHGGSAAIRTGPTGTEVQLTLPHEAEGEKP